MELEYGFVPMGYSARSEPGKVYVDVGNAFCPGILDHHHPDAPDACTAALVLNHPEYVRSQVVGDRLKIITHEYPDMDATTGAYFATKHALGEAIMPHDHRWSEYVCWIDRGFTTLDPERPVTPYSLFMMRLNRVGMRAKNKSRQMLASGFEFLETISRWMAQEDGDPFNPNPEELTRLFPDEANAVADDLALYRKDLARAERLKCKLPRKDGNGFEEVPGLWIERPESTLFKSWARGDRENSGADKGFVFLGVQVSDHRFILSVDPASDVYLKGLGAALEKAEVENRKKLGLERVGENRPGYGSHDPWYDGRSNLHNYTIIDSPQCGTVLRAEEVRQLFQHWMTGIETGRPGGNERSGPN